MFGAIALATAINVHTLQQRFHVNVSGANDRCLSEIALALQEDRHTTHNGVRIEIRNFDDRGLAFWYAGLYDDKIRTITVQNDECTSSVLQHELAHATTWDLLKKDLRIIREWQKLAIDENGKSYYKEIMHTMGPFYFVTNNRHPPPVKDIHEKGFTTNHALDNMFEDIAEVRTRVLDPLCIIDAKNPIFLKKVALAATYNILPKETPEYISLLVSDDELNKQRIALERRVEYGSEVFICMQQEQKERVDKFMHESGAFLSKYPSSVYNARVHNIRSTMPLMLGEINYSEKAIRTSIAELEAAVHRDYLGEQDYPLYLDSLAWLYGQVGEVRKAREYRIKFQNYLLALQTGDLEVVLCGLD